MADTKISDLTAVTDVIGTDEYVLARSGATRKIDASDLAAGISIYVQVREEQAQNTQGGTFTSGAWQTRTLNTETADADNVCSLASNQITLAAGTYICRISCPASYCGFHQARLQNVTDGTTVLVGTSEYLQATLANAVAGRSFVSGQFTIAASKALEVQHRCSITKATDGLGVAANFGTEVYTVAEFWKVG